MNAPTLHAPNFVPGMVRTADAGGGAGEEEQVRALLQDP